MKISQKLKLFPLLAIATVITLYALFNRDISRQNTHIYEIYADRVIPLQELKSISDGYAVNVIDSLNKYHVGLLNQEETINHIKTEIASANRTFADYLKIIPTKEEVQLAEQAQQQLDQTNIELEEILTLISTSHSRENTDQLIIRAYNSVDPLSEAINALVAIQLTITDDIYNLSVEEADSSHVINITFALVALAIMFITSYWINRQISQSIVNISQTMRNITADLDLSRKLDDTGSDELSTLSADINRMITAFNDALSRVTSSSELTTAEIMQIEKQTKNNVDSLSQQAAQTDLVVTAVTELSCSANAVAQSTTDAAESAETANKFANEARETVATTYSSMEDLIQEVNNAASNVTTMSVNTKQISETLTIIRDIAEQTNLLALNAAIEAARAGEQGRGFAVVADEVRALAARTQSCTANISEIIEKLQYDAQQAVSSMDSTKESSLTTNNQMLQVIETLESAVSSIGQINNLNSEIATAASEQSAVSEEVSQSINMISEMMSHLNQSSQQTLNTAHRLSEANQELNQVVGSFKR